MSHSKWMLLAIPASLGLLALAPLQDPTAPAAELPVAQRLRFSVLQYVDTKGELVEVAARDLIEIKLHLTPEDASSRLEIYYENGDYSMVHTSAFHIIRRSAIPNQEITLTRTDGAGMNFIFPKIP